MSKYLVKCDPIEGGCGEIYPADLIQCPKCKGSTSIMGTYVDLDPLIYIYDIETYPNIFTCAILHPSTGVKWLFEISDRINMVDTFVKFLYQLQKCGATMVGFNNCYFDYLVIHYIAQLDSNITVDLIYKKAMDIIKGIPQAPIWDNQRIVKQLDLFKINHYDNKSKSTSLKALEFAMRMDSIQDLPVELWKVLTSDEQDRLISYNWHDILATVFFYVRNLEQIEFRKKMSQTYDKDFTNMSDSKIGSEIFVKKLNDAGIRTHGRINGKREVINTKRKQVALIDCIPGYIQFERPEFQEILNRFKNTTLYGDNVKALFKNFNTEIDGLTYVYGGGGCHACRPGVFKTTTTRTLLDIDVEAYYPSNIIANNIYPEHLGNTFSPLFKELITERKRVGKKSKMGQAYKLASNSIFGNMGNKYSPFYDLKALLSVTLTGQLSLTMLIEQLMKIPGIIIIQINTDGFTVDVPNEWIDHLKTVVSWWENMTSLKMEYAVFDKLFMNDVNNFIAVIRD